MKAPLVELVDDDGAEIGEQRILLEARGQNALGRHQQSRRRVKAALEPDMPAHFAADRPPTLERDPLRDRPRRDAARLEQDDRPVIDERRRHSGRLSRAWLRRDDDRA